MYYLYILMMHINNESVIYDTLSRKYAFINLCPKKDYQIFSGYYINLERSA